MKINIETADNHYMGIPFASLVNIVFTPSGDRKRCSRKAVVALIIRLERYYHTDGFGSIHTGKLNTMDAYVASIMMLNHLNGSQ